MLAMPNFVPVPVLFPASNETAVELSDLRTNSEEITSGSRGSQTSRTNCYRVINSWLLPDYRELTCQQFLERIVN